MKPGTIPDGWTSAPLGELCGRITTGKLDANAMVADGEYPFFTCARESYRINRYAFDTEALLVSGNGANVGYVHYYKGKFNAYQRTYVLSEFTADVHFLKMFLDRNLQDRIRVEVNAGNTPYITMGTLTEMGVVLPNDAAEQRAIATALSDVDGLLGGLDRLIAKKRDLKQAAMQQLLTGQTRLPGFHAEWEVKRLGDVADMGSGGTPPSSVPDFYDGDIPWASISDMTKGGKSILSTDRNLTRAGFANSAAQMFPAGTILYAMYASLGECSIAGISLCSSQAILGIRPKNKLSGEYLYYFLTSLKGIVKTLGQQGTQANLNKGMVQDFRLSLPPLPEQTAIADVMTEMDGELAGLTQRREKTRALKQAMMQELLTGKTRLI